MGKAADTIEAKAQALCDARKPKFGNFLGMNFGPSVQDDIDAIKSFFDDKYPNG